MSWTGHGRVLVRVHLPVYTVYVRPCTHRSPSNCVLLASATRLACPRILLGHARLTIAGMLLNYLNYRNGCVLTPVESLTVNIYIYITGCKYVSGMNPVIDWSNHRMVLARAEGEGQDQATPVLDQPDRSQSKDNQTGLSIRLT